MKTIIKNGIIISDGIGQKADILFEDSSIKMIGDLEKLDITETIEIVDATDKYVFPGIIDPNINFDYISSGCKSADNFETGSAAALIGGTTTVIDTVFPIDGKTLKESLDIKRESVEGHSYIDYSFHIIIGKWQTSFIKEIEYLIHNKGIPTFKMFLMSDENNLIVDESDLYSALKTIRHEGMLMVHAENKKIIDCLYAEALENSTLKPKDIIPARPSWIEAESFSKAALIAAKTNSSLYFINTTSADSINRLKPYKNAKLNVFSETSVPHLILTEEKMSMETGYLFITDPPLRTKEDKNALWRALEDGFIDIISSRHCSFKKEEKEKGKDDFRKSPAGLPSSEWMLPLLYTEGVEKAKITLPKLIDHLTSIPAKIFGLYPKKGTFQIGSDADIVIFDPSKMQKLSNEYLVTKAGYNPYAGMMVKGAVEQVFLRGKEMYKDSRIQGNTGDGSFLKRQIR